MIRSIEFKNTNILLYQLFVLPVFLLVLLTAITPSKLLAKNPNPKKIPIKQVQLPAFKEAMLKPEYWLNKLSKPNAMIWNQKEINRYNQNNLDKGYVLNPFKLGRFINIIRIRDYIDSDLKFIRSYIKYDLKGSRRRDPKFGNWLKSITDYKLLIDKSNSKSDFVRIDYGMVIHKNAELRYFPTDLKIYRKPQDREFEILKKSHLETFTIVAVLHYSADQQWAYIETPISRGWVKKQYLAISSLDSIKLFFTGLKQGVVVTSLAQIYQQPNKDRIVNDLVLPMGTKVYYKKIDLNAEYTTIIIPKQQAGGRIYKKEFFIKTADIVENHLPFTYKNLIEQGFKFLGSEYTWGGSYDKTDCSLFLYRVFASFGLNLPRSSSQQIKSFNYIPVKRNQYHNQSDKLTPFTSVAYIPGPTHIMLYLGKVNKKDFYLQSTWSFYDQQKNEYLIRGVVVSDLSLGEDSRQGSLETKISALGIF